MIVLGGRLARIDGGAIGDERGSFLMRRGDLLNGARQLMRFHGDDDVGDIREDRRVVRHQQILPGVEELAGITRPSGVKA